MNRFSRLDQFIFHLFLVTIFVIPFSITLNDVFMSLIIFLWASKIILRRERMKVPPLGWLFLLFLFVSIMSAMVSEYKMQALRGVWDIARYTVIFFMVINMVNTIDRVKKVFWTLALSTGLWVTAGMVHQFIIQKRELFVLLKFFSLGNKNAIGQYLQMMLSILVGVYLTNSFSLREKLVLILILLVSLLGLFLSSSKTMWVASIVTFILFAWLKKSRQISLGIVGIGILFLLAAWVSDPVKKMSFQILEGIYAPSMQERLVGWKQSYHVFSDHLLLGVGPKCFQEIRDPYRIIPAFGQAHNMILHVACEMGLLGVASLVGWIAYYVYFISTYKKKITHPIFLGIWYGGVGFIVTLGIGGITEPTIGNEHSQLFMALVGLLHGGLNPLVGNHPYQNR
jgi:O-antigen ligase